MIERSDYKGHPVIILKRDSDDTYPFIFGVAKAKLVLQNIDEIRAFVEEGEKIDSQYDAPVPEPPIGFTAVSNRSSGEPHILKGIDEVIMAKLFALKAYCIGTTERDPFAKESAIKLIKGTSGTPLPDEPEATLKYRQFFLITLAELTRGADPIPYREKAARIGRRLEAMHMVNQFPYYLKIVEYVTEKATTADYGDFTGERATGYESHIDEITSATLELNINTLPSSVIKFLFVSTLADIFKHSPLGEKR